MKAVKKSIIEEVEDEESSRKSKGRRKMERTEFSPKKSRQKIFEENDQRKSTRKEPQQ